MSDPNTKLAETQRTVARALADLHRHARVDGIVIAAEMFDDELEAANARIRVLESQQTNVLEAVIRQFGDKLRPVIATQRRYAAHNDNVGLIPHLARYQCGYAQALEDFLAGDLTR